MRASSGHNLDTGGGENSAKGFFFFQNSVLQLVRNFSMRIFCVRLGTVLPLHLTTQIYSDSHMELTNADDVKDVDNLQSLCGNQFINASWPSYCMVCLLRTGIPESLSVQHVVVARRILEVRNFPGNVLRWGQNTRPCSISPTANPPYNIIAPPPPHVLHQLDKGTQVADPLPCPLKAMAPLRHFQTSHFACDTLQLCWKPLRASVRPS